MSASYLGVSQSWQEVLPDSRNNHVGLVVYCHIGQPLRLRNGHNARDSFPHIPNDDRAVCAPADEFATTSRLPVNIPHPCAMSFRSAENGTRPETSVKYVERTIRMTSSKQRARAFTVPC